MEKQVRPVDMVELRSWCIEQVLSKTSMSANKPLVVEEVIDAAKAIEDYIVAEVAE